MNFSNLYFSRFFASNIYFYNYSRTSVVKEISSSSYSIQPNFSITSKVDSTYTFNFFVSPDFKDLRIAKNYFSASLVSRHFYRFSGFNFPLFFTDKGTRFDFSWYFIQNALHSNRFYFSEPFGFRAPLRLSFFFLFIQFNFFAIKTYFVNFK